jgi:aminopeptidase N
MKRVLFLLAAFALVAAGCSDSSTDSPAPTPPEASSTTVPSTVSTTTHPPVTTTTAPPPTAAPTTDHPPPTTGSIVARRLGIGDEYYPDLGNPDYDVQHYQLDIIFDPIANHLEAVATITAMATEQFRTFNLDFDQLTIDAIRVDGAPAEFAHAYEELTILPAQPIAPGTEFTIEVAYSGSPVPAPTDAIAFNTGWFTSSDGSEAFVVAEPDNAHTWFPSNDHPLDKATFLFNLTVPEEIIAAANGTLVSTTPVDDGMATWQWRMDDPMATYLATVVIGEFDLVVDEAASLDAGFPIRHVLPRGTTISDWPGLERQGEMLAFLADLFGPYPFDNYGIAIVDGFQNALETQTLTVFGRRFTDPQFFERVLVHELAHQWFGNSVSTGLWRDIWLNEGFASYAEWLWLESERSRNFLETNIENERAFFAENGARPPGDPLADDLFNQSVYRVGAMTLHALRLTVGDDSFFEILQIYHSRFADGTATTDDFVTVAEEVSARDLTDLFESWLFGEDIPEFPTG